MELLILKMKYAIIVTTWLYRLTVRTRPSQGCNRGSIPRRVTNF